MGKPAFRALNIALGRKLGANATPTWILPNGEVGSGAIPLQEIRVLLDAK